MMTNSVSETAKTVVRRNTIEVQGGGNWELFDELFADDLVIIRRNQAVSPTRLAYSNSTAG